MRLASVILFSLIMSSAAAQAPNPNCSSRSAALNSVDRMFHEKPILLGPANEGNTIIVTVSPTGSWSLFMCSGPICCMKAAGQKLQFLKGA